MPEKNHGKGELISEEIEVTAERHPKRPLEFSWRGRRYKVLQVIDSWLDWGFPGGSPKRTNWRLRRHRSYFLIKADDNHHYEIYLDRKAQGGREAWVLSRAFLET